MGRASRTKALARASAKISATIIDFGEPLLVQLAAEQPDAAVQRATFQFILHVWNAHVLAMPTWGQPQHLAALHTTLQRQAQLGEVEAFQALRELTRRRRQPRFVNDYRAVGTWGLRHLPDGSLNLYCDARVPGNGPMAGIDPQHVG